MKKYFSAIAQRENMTYLGSGISREAYLSKRSNLVFKIPYGSNKQSNNEEKLFNSLSPMYKQIFPAVAFVNYHGRKVVVMKKVRPIAEIDMHTEYCDEDLEDISTFVEMAEKVGASKKSAYLLYRAIRNYQIRDLFEKNIGVDSNGNLVILDAGSCLKGM